MNNLPDILKLAEQRGLTASAIRFNGSYFYFIRHAGRLLNEYGLDLFAAKKFILDWEPKEGFEKC